RPRGPRRVPVHARGIDEEGAPPLVHGGRAAGGSRAALPEVRRADRGARAPGLVRCLPCEHGSGARQRRSGHGPPRPARSGRERMTSSRSGKGPAPVEPPVRRYLDHLTAERGLVRNTVQAYAQDLLLLRRSLPPARALESVRHDDLLAALRGMRVAGRSPRSVARWIVTVRGFYGHLLESGAVQENPARHLESPRLL